MAIAVCSIRTKHIHVHNRPAFELGLEIDLVIHCPAPTTLNTQWCSPTNNTKRRPCSRHRWVLCELVMPRVAVHVPSTAMLSQESQQPTHQGQAVHTPRKKRRWWVGIQNYEKETRAAVIVIVVLVLFVAIALATEKTKVCRGLLSMVSWLFTWMNPVNAKLLILFLHSPSA